MKSALPLLPSLAVLLTSACAPSSEAPAPEEISSPAAGSDVSSLEQALTFHASFDDLPDADFARGDATLFTAPSYGEVDQAEPGIGNPDVRLDTGAGRFGGALDFTSRNRHAIFFRADKNVAYAPSGWSGTVSFWLRLDPAVDLEPGFCDPIQITDTRYNDAAVWVDFTRENPRHFRLGIFGDLDVWNPKEIDEHPMFEERLAVEERPPFSRESWTHVVITFTGLGSDAGGTANLYLNGVANDKTVTGIGEPFTWDLARGTIRLGINYVGLFDELSLFDRALSTAEVQTLHGLETGVGMLHQ